MNPIKARLPLRHIALVTGLAVCLLAAPARVQAGQFLQIENQLMLFIDITIAGEMPLVGERTK